MSIALLFPGQGAQTPGFLHALPSHPAVAATLAEASEALGHDVLTLDTPASLTHTVPVQLALLTAGVAFARLLAAESVPLAAAAGMSVGAFAAAVAAQALTLPHALQFVQKRAQLMDQTLSSGTGMAVLEGLRQPAVERLLAGTSATLANLNSLTQFVLAGSHADLAHILAAAPAAGAHKARLLDTPTASHTRTLAPAAEELHRFALTLPLTDPRIPVFSNRTARPLFRAAALREDLAWNMAHPVRWFDLITALAERGTTLFLESPPGHTLTRLATESLPHIPALPAAETRWDILVRQSLRPH